MNMTFGLYSSRDGALIRKGGQEGIDLGNKQEMIYDA